MKKIHHKRGGPRTIGSGSQHVTGNDFYAGAPPERPLYRDRASSESGRIRKTTRHQEAAGRREQTIDPREQNALMGIIKSVIIILLLLILFFMLWKGINIYEENIRMNVERENDQSSMMAGDDLARHFDIASIEDRKSFAERIEIWSEAERLISRSDALEQRNNYDLAIERCLDALRIDPGHMGALERLGRLYFQKKQFDEAINAYVRLLSIDPTRADLQKAVIRALDARNDSSAVLYMSRWYLEQNHYDEQVQQYLAYALFDLEEYEEAGVTFERVLKDTPRDAEALRMLAHVYMELEDYERAIDVLLRLNEVNYRDQDCYRNTAICYAQLGKGLETVQTLGKAAHLFGQELVVRWVQDPMLDPVRQNRTFQGFADRVGGEEFRKWLETVAQTLEEQRDESITPQLELPENETIDSELLKPRQ